MNEESVTRCKCCGEGRGEESWEAKKEERRKNVDEKRALRKIKSTKKSEKGR